MKVEKNTNDLCHSCSKNAFIDIIYTRYGANITLCLGCSLTLAGKLAELFRPIAGDPNHSCEDPNCDGVHPLMCGKPGGTCEQKE